MYETYSMLGREHEADLAREAARRRLAASARPGRQAVAHRRAGTVALLLSRLARSLRRDQPVPDSGPRHAAILTQEEVLTDLASAPFAD